MVKYLVETNVYLIVEATSSTDAHEAASDRLSSVGARVIKTQHLKLTDEQAARAGQRLADLREIEESARGLRSLVADRLAE